MKKVLLILAAAVITSNILAETSLLIKETNPKNLLYTTIRLNELNTDVGEIKDFFNDIICMKSFGYLYFIDSQKNELLWRSNENFGYENIDYEKYTLIQRNIDGSQVAIILNPEKNKLTGYNAQYGIKDWELDFENRRVISPLRSYTDGRKKYTYLCLDNNEVLKIDNAGNIVYRSKLKDKIGKTNRDLVGLAKDIKISKDYLIVYTTENYTYFVERDNNISFSHLTAYESIGYAPHQVSGESLINVKSISTETGEKYVLELLKINDSLNIDESIIINGKIIHPLVYFEPNSYAVIFIDNETNKRTINTYKISLSAIDKKLQLESSITIPDDVSVNFKLVGIKEGFETGDLILIDNEGFWEIDAVSLGMSDIGITRINLEKSSTTKVKYLSINELYKKNIINKSKNINFNGNLYISNEFLYFILTVDIDNDNNVLLGSRDLFADEEEYKYFSHGEISYSDIVTMDSELFFLNTDNDIINASLYIDKERESTKRVISKFGFDQLISGIAIIDDSIIIIGEKSLQLQNKESLIDNLDILPSSKGVEFIKKFNILNNLIFLLSTDGKLNICSIKDNKIKLEAEKYIANDIDVKKLKDIKSIDCLVKNQSIYIFIRTNDNVIIYKYYEDGSKLVDKIIDIQTERFAVNSSNYRDFDFVYSVGNELLLVSFDKNDSGGTYTIETLNSNIRVANSIVISNELYNDPLCTDNYIIIPNKSGLDLYNIKNKKVINTIVLEDRVKSSMVFYKDSDLLVFFDEQDRVNFIEVSDISNKLLGRYKINGQINIKPFYLKHNENYIIMQANDGTFYLFNIERLI